jgi:hypothetical protein
VSINYSNYTLDELFDVNENIDKEKYPERYKQLCEEIQRRKENGELKQKMQEAENQHNGGILDSLFYRHRRFKGEKYFRDRFPIAFVISLIFSVFIADSYIGCFLGVFIFMSIDMLLALGAWLYYSTDL